MRCGSAEPHERHRIDESWSGDRLVSFNWCRGVWAMPDWMEPYRGLIGDTGGNSIEELYNDETTAQQNLIRAALALAVRDQVNLLYRLMHGGHLVNREVFEQVQRYATELQEDGYDELGGVGQTLVDTVGSLEVKG